MVEEQFVGGNPIRAQWRDLVPTQQQKKNYQESLLVVYIGEMD